MHLFNLLSLLFFPSLYFCLPNPLLSSPSQIWRGPCRLKNEGSHFGRRLLLWKREKLPSEEKKGNGARRREYEAQRQAENGDGGDRDHSVPF